MHLSIPEVLSVYCSELPDLTVTSTVTGCCVILHKTFMREVPLQFEVKWLLSCLSFNERIAQPLFYSCSHLSRAWLKEATYKVLNSH
jgi:hypothetical protein